MGTTVAALDSSAQSETKSVSSLTKMLVSCEDNAGEPEDSSWKERLFRFIIIAGSRYTLVALSILIHALVFLLGLMHYDNNLNGLKTYNSSSVALLIAEASTVVLHFDLGMVLLPVCRTLMCLLEETPIRLFLGNGNAVRLFGFV